MFLNSDRSILSSAGRNVTLISLDDFKTKIVERAMKVDEFFLDSIEEGALPKDCPNEIATSLVYNDTNIIKDFKFNVDFENLSADPAEVFGGFETIDNLLGFRITPFGMPYLGVHAGGDWEFPLFFIIYFDGNKFRAYMPSYGNVVNLDCKCALGSEDDCEFIGKVVKNYIKKGWLSSGVKYDGYDLRNTYLTQQGFTEETVQGDWKAILEDISYRFNVIK